MAGAPPERPAAYHDLQRAGGSGVWQPIVGSVRCV